MGADTPQPFRVNNDAPVDRTRTLRFSFNGRDYAGHPGDTLAAALLANGVHFVARSFKYHRPRGLFAIGADEPNALLEIGAGASVIPNARATMVELEDGLEARSQNCWPSLELDLLSINSLFSSVLRAGFYYKTFMSPRALWPLYEKLIRRAAGLGRAPALPDPDRYEHRHATTDILIVGAGPAGIAAARNAMRSGLRVMLVDEQFVPGGWLRHDRVKFDERPAAGWIAGVCNELANAGNVTMLTRTTAFGLYDHGTAGLLQCLPAGASNGPRERLWMVRARQIILATGAIERPIPFADNDRPGTLLAGAARGYLNAHGVLAGRRAVLLTNNDHACRSALDLHDAGAAITAVVDLRPSLPDALAKLLHERGIPVWPHSTPVCAEGSTRVTALRIRDATGQTCDLPCDLLCVSGGWTPSVHLFAQRSRNLRYAEDIGAFVPGSTISGVHTAGAVTGQFGTRECIESGTQAAQSALAGCGAASMPALRIPGITDPLPADPSSRQGLWSGSTPESGRSGEDKCFVDLQNDVTLADLRQARREGYESVEHLKRYTTLGMGTDQGKTSNLIGLGFLAGMRGVPIESLGVTTYRPPYTPVTLGALAGPHVGAHIAPVRRAPLHDAHAGVLAVFGPNGLWLRPEYYPQAGESAAETIEREVLAVRRQVGIVDVSTLGKFEISGAEALTFLNRIYLNSFDSLGIGQVRYGVMLREDGMVFDDGTVTRLGEQHYFLTTTSANAEGVHDHLEYWLEVCWPELDVNIAAVTEQWAAIAVSGPQSRTLLSPLLRDADIAAESLPHMHACALTFEEHPARLLRVSYSGELAFELYVPASKAVRLWQSLIAEGADLGVTRYGMEAMDVLRVEKGHFALGAEADGRASPVDLGLGRIAERKQTPFIGRQFLQLPALRSTDRELLVGLRSNGRDDLLRDGAQLLAAPGDRGFGAGIGRVSSAAWSPTLQCSIGLALLRNGRERIGQSVHLYDALHHGERSSAVDVVDPCFYDPAGERLRS